MAIVLLPLLIELTTQLRQKQGEVFLVGGTFDISLQTALHRELPVDIDSIEQARPAPNEEIDRRRREPASRGVGERGVGEARGAAPSSHRDGELEVRVA